jgi:predicted site-specific integrase-resolvase
MNLQECNSVRVWPLTEVARRLDINPETLRRHAREGKVTFVKVFDQYRFRFRDIAAMIGQDEAAELFAVPSKDAGGATRRKK